MSNEELSTFAAPRSPALGLRLKPSRRLAAALAAAHLACAGLLWPLALAFWLKLALAGGLGASLIWRLRRDAFLSLADDRILENGPLPGSDAFRSGE